MGLDLDPSAGWDRDFKVTCVTGEPVFSNPARIAVICYSSTSRIHLNGWSGDIMEVDAAAHRMDVYMAVANVGKSNRPTESFYVQVGITDVCHFD